jgi:hypothetical protein
VIDAYAQLLDQYDHELEHPERVDMHDVEQVRRRATRLDILRTAAIALHQGHRDPPDDDVTAELCKRLAAAPLLRSSTGRLISIEQGRQVRPTELNHLHLWDPRDPASDKFESELLGALAEAREQAEVEAAAPKVEPVQEPTGFALLAALVGRVVKGKPELSDEERELITPDVPDVPVVPVAPPDPIGELLEAIREELRLVRKGQESLLAEGLLDRIEAKPGRRRGRGPLVAIDDGAVVFDSQHPCFEQALAQPDDPIWVSFLASVAYTALNHWQVEVTDADELAFHARHATLLASAVLNPA